MKNRAGITVVAGVFVYIAGGNFLTLWTALVLAILAACGAWMLTAGRQDQRDRD